MSLKYSLNNQLCFTAIEQLMRFANNICRLNILPQTRYVIDKLCNSDSNTILHCVCPSCSKYTGTFEDLTNSVKCYNCGTIIKVSTPSDSNFFAIIDPSNNIRDSLEKHEVYYDYIVKERLHEKSCTKDIYDGKLYRNFIKNLPSSEQQAYVTVNFNTDGAPVFKSSNFSIWPIYLLVNEIPVQDRLNSMIVTGLWFGKHKPEMSVFLEIFVKKMNKISDTGIQCKI